MKWLFLGILLKITSFLCKMKSKVTFDSDVCIQYNSSFYLWTTTIQILFMKYKQSLLINLKKTFQLWIKSSISLTAVLNDIRITKTLLICVIISKILISMLNRWQVMASHHAMVLGDLLNVMLQIVVYKDP